MTIDYYVVFKIYLKAKRAELVDSGELDPNISRSERLSKEPSLSLKTRCLGIYTSHLTPTTKITTIIKRELCCPTCTLQSRSGSSRQHWDVGGLGTRFDPPSAHNPF